MVRSEIQNVKLRFGIIGNAEGLNRAIDVAIQVAPTDLSVLITGESGVGKENFPQIIHQFSRRKHGQYIAVNCGNKRLYYIHKKSPSRHINSRISGFPLWLLSLSFLPHF